MVSYSMANIVGAIELFFCRVTGWSADPFFSPHQVYSVIKKVNLILPGIKAYGQIMLKKKNIGHLFFLIILLQAKQ